MNYFVAENSTFRKIWGKADTVLFIFAGAAAEFALNKAVDWLYFTGRLPADPLGRLFSTVTYARHIIFSDAEKALRSIDQINQIHQTVEQNRGAQIPDWAYRDVLFLLIYYSIRSYELLDSKLTEEEKAEVFDVFYRVGLRMQLIGLPNNFKAYQVMRQDHLQQNLVSSTFTTDLYIQYRKHLGYLRYVLLVQVQQRLVPKHVKNLLKMPSSVWIKRMLKAYKLARNLHIEKLLRNALLPMKFKAQILELDTN